MRHLQSYSFQGPSVLQLSRRVCHVCTSLSALVLWLDDANIQNRCKLAAMLAIEYEATKYSVQILSHSHAGSGLNNYSRGGDLSLHHR